ncbi:hypothetical protein L3X38_004416 [Prunus dulcis]|uniref:Uncharacterized protein n=1 Tax=Prunus dulcis TaxID=3755 RepID=A0AAD4ZNY7_PRUDU|nr:hypothetical protein L3X38_004416 [Prunus dulcis]
MASYKLGSSHLARYCPLWAHSTVSGKDLFRGSYILTPQRPPSRWMRGYCPLWAWLHSHQPARFWFWELTEQLPRVVTHPGIAPASNSLNFGVPTNPKPVSSQNGLLQVGGIPSSKILSSLGPLDSVRQGFVPGQLHSHSPEASF